MEVHPVGSCWFSVSFGFRGQNAVSDCVSSFSLLTCVSFFSHDIKECNSHVMRKPVFANMRKQRRRSAERLN